MTAMTFGRPAALRGAGGQSPQANRYRDDSLSTASPAALLVMLYDRFVLDLQRAEQFLEAGDREAAHHNLIHAQDIVAELGSGLQDDVWSGAAGLRSLYTWIAKELAVANMSGDAEKVRVVRTQNVEPLADAWRQAALEHLSATGVPTGDGVA